MVSPFIGSGFALPGFTDDRDSTTAENLTHRFWSRASSLKKPLDGTSKRESSTVGRFSSFKSHQPSQEIATTVEAEDAKGARRASKHNRIFKAIVKKWLTMRKNTTETPGILKRNDPDDVAPQPPPMIPYGILIAEALQYSGEPSLSAKKICKHIMESYKWYKDNQHVGWQVSHSKCVVRTCRTIMIDSARVKSSKSCLKTLVSKLFLSVKEDGLAIASSGA